MIGYKAISGITFSKRKSCAVEFASDSERRYRECRARPFTVQRRLSECPRSCHSRAHFAVFSF